MCVTVAQLLSTLCHTVGVKVKRVPVMMRPADVARLDALARARDVSRGALIRQAVREFLERELSRHKS